MQETVKQTKKTAVCVLVLWIIILNFAAVYIKKQLEC